MIRKAVLLSIVALVAGALIADGVYSNARAQGAIETRAELDAGADQVEQLDAGPYRTAAPPSSPSSTPASTPPATVTDPADVTGFLETLRSYWERGLFKPFTLLACFGIAWWLAASWPLLQRGRMVVVAAAVVDALQDLVARSAMGVDVGFPMVLSAVGSALLLALAPRWRPSKAAGELEVRA